MRRNIKKLNSDLERIANWLTKNNLLANLKKSNPECVLCGTHQKTSESKPMEIIINQTKMMVSDEYEYLGVKMDRNLTINDHLEKTIKRPHLEYNYYHAYGTTSLLMQQKQFMR